MESRTQHVTVLMPVLSRCHHHAIEGQQFVITIKDTLAQGRSLPYSSVHTSSVSFHVMSEPLTAVWAIPNYLVCE